MKAVAARLASPCRHKAIFGDAQNVAKDLTPSQHAFFVLIAAFIIQ
jgi:hypothetical protein